MKKISPKNNKNNWSDSEHTQLLQTCKDERFGMIKILVGIIQLYPSYSYNLRSVG